MLPLSGLPEALELMRGEAGKILLIPSLPDPEPRASVQRGANGTLGRT
jgi:hypothetical protein